jgi:pimeloyl-ACP methyl ester carboxylesterase
MNEKVPVFWSAGTAAQFRPRGIAEIWLIGDARESVPPGSGSTFTAMGPTKGAAQMTSDGTGRLNGIAFEARGVGVPLLFIHGFPHNRSLWKPQFDALSLSARCISLDLRGFGDSTGEPPYTMDAYAHDAARIVSAATDQRAVVVGLSMGGYIALALWRSHRSSVAGLILADTRAGADSEEGRRKRDANIALVRERGVEALAEAQIEGMLGKTTRAGNPALVRRVRAMMETASREGVIGALGAMRDRPDSTELLATIDVPTLVLVGEEDVLTPPKEAQLLHEGIRGSLLEVIPASGHLSNLERPDLFNRAVSAFLASQPLNV